MHWIPSFNLWFQIDHSNERSSLSLQLHCRSCSFMSAHRISMLANNDFRYAPQRKKGRLASSGREHASLMFDHCSQQFGWPPPPQPPHDKGFNCIGFHHSTFGFKLDHSNERSSLSLQLHCRSCSFMSAHRISMLANQRFQVRAPKKKGAIGELRKRTYIYIYIFLF